VRLNRTRGEILWMRAHFDGRLRAEIRGAGGGSCVVLVRRGDEPMRETRLALDAERARDAADQIIGDLFPHTCTTAECGSWVAMGTARKSRSTTP
jgi:hypothetical protein